LAHLLSNNNLVISFALTVLESELMIPLKARYSVSNSRIKLVKIGTKSSRSFWTFSTLSLFEDDISVSSAFKAFCISCKAPWRTLIFLQLISSRDGLCFAAYIKITQILNNNNIMNSLQMIKNGF
jgi:hypothetical protein